MIRSLPRSTPSAHDVDAGGIAGLLDALESTPEVEPHSIMVLRHGAVIAEGWWAPYAQERVHLLYSLSKSFTSTAVGLAVAEGRLGLDDTVIGHFPELDAEITDLRSRSMTVRHLLAMASGHREETHRRALTLDPGNLVRGFLMIPPDEEPGSVFAYNQPCTYTAAAIVQRLTGQTLTEYLRPRLFDPLGIGQVGWLQDGSGREIGYSGLHAGTEAIAALGQLYLQRGSWNGVQLLPAEWVDEATRLQVSNGTAEDSDWEQGYGFQFWMARHGYRGDGAYGQFCVVLPEHDLVLAITGQSTDMQAVLDLAWQTLLPAIGKAGDAGADEELAARLAALALPPLGGGPLDGGFLDAGVGLRLPGIRSFSAAAGGDHPTLTRIDLKNGASSTEVVLTLTEGDARVEVPCGVRSWTTTGAIAASASASSTPDAGIRLLVDLVFVETPHRLHLALDEETATFTARWETAPLHDLPLSAMRNPADAALQAD